jgi:hypothetical protein
MIVSHQRRQLVRAMNQQWKRVLGFCICGSLVQSTDMNQCHQQIGLVWLAHKLSLGNGFQVWTLQRITGWTWRWSHSWCSLWQISVCGFWSESWCQLELVIESVVELLLSLVLDGNNGMSMLTHCLTVAKHLFILSVTQDNGLMLKREQLITGMGIESGRTVSPEVGPLLGPAT